MENIAFSIICQFEKIFRYGGFMPKYNKQWWNDVMQHKAKTFGIMTLKLLLKKCKDNQERMFLILLYYTGARPAELLSLTADSIDMNEGLIIIQLPTLKHGIGRTLSFNPSEYTNEALNYAKSLSIDAKLFPKWKFSWQTRDFIYKISDGQLTQYFFRHNRMSKLAAKGANIFELKEFKGARSTESVEDYVHMSGNRIKKLAEMTD
jgi:integrase